MVRRGRVGAWGDATSDPYMRVWDSVYALFRIEYFNRGLDSKYVGIITPDTLSITPIVNRRREAVLWRRCGV